MKLMNLLHISESYTHDGWIYRDVSVSFSRLYYIIDGTAYYREGENERALKKGHLYLTPVKRPFTIWDENDDKLLHTYAHVITDPPVAELMEIEPIANTPLADAVSLWRRHIHSSDQGLLQKTTALVLYCIDGNDGTKSDAARSLKELIDSSIGFEINMEEASRRLGYSREHLTRAFTSAYHTTPKKYTISKRMNEALLHLLRGEHIGDVASLIGYSSPYSFTRAFKEYFGLSPSNYLKTYKKRGNAPDG